MLRLDAIKVIKDDALYSPIVAQTAIKSLESWDELMEELKELINNEIKENGSTDLALGLDLALCITNKYKCRIERV